jgi:transposase
MAAKPNWVVAMEAYVSSHHWVRAIGDLGHEVRLVPPTCVKPFVKRQKNDMADAGAISEAASRPTMRFVAAKREARQAAALAYRTWDLLVRQRARHAEKDLHRQAGLDRSIAADGLSPTFAGRLCFPDHISIEPALRRLRAIALRPMDRQRPTTLESLVILGPIQGHVVECVRSAHALQLSRWIHKMNPSQDLCNRASGGTGLKG